MLWIWFVSLNSDMAFSYSVFVHYYYYYYYLISARAGQPTGNAECWIVDMKQLDWHGSKQQSLQCTLYDNSSGRSGYWLVSWRYICVFCAYNEKNEPSVDVLSARARSLTQTHTHTYTIINKWIIISGVTMHKDALTRTQAWRRGSHECIAVLCMAYTEKNLFG